MEDPGMKRVAAVLTLAMAVTLAALGYAQHNGAPPDVSPRANDTGSDMTNCTLPSGWANPNTRGPYESVNNSGDAESPSVAAPAAPIDSGTTLSQSSGDDNSNATSGNDANGSGWGTSDSSATGGSDNGGSDPGATGGSDTSENDSSATSDSDSDTTSGESGDNSTDSGGNDTSISDSADGSGWK